MAGMDVVLDALEAEPQRIDGLASTKSLPNAANTPATRPSSFFTGTISMSSESGVLHVDGHRPICPVTSS